MFVMMQKSMIATQRHNSLCLLCCLWGSVTSVPILPLTFRVIFLPDKLIVFGVNAALGMQKAGGGRLGVT